MKKCNRVAQYTFFIFTYLIIMFLTLKSSHKKSIWHIILIAIIKTSLLV